MVHRMSLSKTLIFYYYYFYSDLSSISNLQDVIIQLFNSPSEEIRSAASYALGIVYVCIYLSIYVSGIIYVCIYLSIY